MRFKHAPSHWMDSIDYPDDGFGNLMIPVGSWYHEHTMEKLPSERHIRANNHGARCFFFGHWHELLNPPGVVVFRPMRLVPVISEPIFEPKITLSEIQAKQHQACGKVWEQHEAGKLTLDQAIEAAHRTQVAMSRDLGKLGYVN